jgi:inner membrane protein involved in colicin E2 resistance
MNMRPLRLASIFLIYVAVSAAWAVLGASISYRSTTKFQELHERVAGLYGTALEQRAPQLTVRETMTTRDSKGKAQTSTASHQLVPDSSDIKVRLHSDARRKGLLWYRTYDVEFDAVYTISHRYTEKPELIAKFSFPSSEAIYDDFQFSVNGREAQLGGDLGQGLSQSIPLPPGQPATIRVHYKSRGLDRWSYVFDEGVARVRDFRLLVDTDFGGFDFPEKSLSPTAKKQTPQGWRLTWQFASLISGLQASVEMPQPLNPGPIIARITYFAPVGLLFFLAVVVIVGMMWRHNPHPMHYFFVGGGFFSFHLLMAYLADHLDLKLTFLICAIVSVLLVVSYLIRAVGASFALRVAAPAQLLFLVLFSYAFFFRGYTGLAITLASVLTLAILMHVTARVDWESRFGSEKGRGASEQ